MAGTPDAPFHPNTRQSVPECNFKRQYNPHTFSALFVCDERTLPRASIPGTGFGRLYSEFNAQFDGTFVLSRCGSVLQQRLLSKLRLLR